MRSILFLVAGVAIGFVVAVLGVIVGLTSITFGPFPPLTSLFGK